jgi:hypothetical protein
VSAVAAPRNVRAAVRGSKLVLSWSSSPVLRVEVWRSGKLIAKLSGSTTKYSTMNKPGRFRYVIVNVGAISGQRAASAPLSVKSSR